VIVAFSDVKIGIGIIVGSSVYNFLFVIGMCSLFSKTVLHLTCWPLFRECTFYFFSLLVFIIFFIDERIEWWEALMLLLAYTSYLIFMKFNTPAKRFLSKILCKKKQPVMLYENEAGNVATGGRDTNDSEMIGLDKEGSVAQERDSPSTTNYQDFIRILLLVFATLYLMFSRIFIIIITIGESLSGISYKASKKKNS
jgi:Ca2+/Na+ antiporter